MSDLTPSQMMALNRAIPDIAEQLIYIDGKPLVLERPWQYDMAGSLDSHSIYEKSRQIGFSFTDALRAVIKAQIMPPGKYNKVFVSINREEAREKIRYAEMLYDSMPISKRKKLKISNKLELIFSNDNTIRSQPSRPVRGIPYVDLSLDEFAHVKEARRIYEGSSASTIRGSNGVTIGSTPFGHGFFNDIKVGAGNNGDFRHFKSYTIPWWYSRVLCQDVDRAMLEAGSMTTMERVHEFGSTSLIREFESQMLEIFMQEFECLAIDSGNSVLTEELIMKCSDGTMGTAIIDVDCDESAVDVEFQVQEALNEVRASGVTECFLGYDVGRNINATEIIILTHRGQKLNTSMYITLRHAPFPVQRDVINLLMNELPIKKAVIDHNGLGMQISEEMLKQYGPAIVVPMNFSVNTKADMVSKLVKAFEDNGLIIYPTRRMLSQLLSVKKVASMAGRILYNASETKEDKGYKSHADLFWALAMAVFGADAFLKGHVAITTRSPILRRGGGVSGWSGRTISPRRR